jgi:glycosyltransferase involved in cell wall biosynthesis
MPTVSIVIPTYNRAQYLVESIQSVSEQTFHDYEIIVVDDGSTDDTKAVLQKENVYKNIIYIYRDNCGLKSAVRNIGIQAAKGKYIAFLDSDDKWLPSKLEKQVAILERDSNCAMVCANAYILRDDVPTKELYVQSETLVSGNVFFKLLHNNFIINSSVLIRKSIVQKLGGLDEDRIIKSSEDYDLWLRVARLYAITSISEPLTLYRIHEGNYSKDVLRTYQGLLYIYGKLLRDKEVTVLQYLRIFYKTLCVGIHAFKVALIKKEYSYVKIYFNMILNIQSKDN